MSDKVPLALAAQEVAKLVGDSAATPSYRALYGKVLDGELPAQQVNGRWQVDRADLRAIAKKLSHKDQDS